MKRISTIVSVALAASLAACSQGVSGGPGATAPPSPAGIVGQAEDTFSLAMESPTLRQGESKLVAVDIKRGKNFNEDILLALKDLPAGVTVGPGSLLIKSNEDVSNLELIAAPDADLGEFTVTLSGHPTQGADAVTKVKLSVAMPDSEAEKAKLEQYTAEMERELAQYTEKFESMRQKVAEATGQAKIDLDLKLTNAKTKLDAATVKVHELKEASVAQWEKVKEGVEVAFSDLKKQFN